MIVIGEMRSGSRWLHYMLCLTFNKQPYPELDRSYLRNKGAIESINYLISQSFVVKFHRVTPKDICNKVNYPVIGIVRNPRDRAVSLAFHNRYYANNDNLLQKKAKTDKEAVDVTVLEDLGFKKSVHINLSLMIPENHHTSNVRTKYKNYIWCNYESLLESPYIVYSNICRFIDPNINQERIDYAVNEMRPEKLFGRKSGQEDRHNAFFRKGINNDWLHWFDNNLKQYSEKDYQNYLNKLYVTN